MSETNNTKKIVLTGGGTAGHVTPNLALLPSLSEAGYEVSYFGSKDGIEKKLLADFPIKYYEVSTGKLRRYFSWKNFTDPFRIIKGYFEARSQLKELNPDIVFSKGGFVSVPIVRAAHSLKIPCIIHESDITPGLANKLCIGAAAKICCNFPETLKYLPSKKAVLTGTPIRSELLSGNKEKGLEFLGFENGKPILLVIGGSQGARAINACVREALPELLKSFQIVHLCGKGNLSESLEGTKGYRQYEYIKDELKDLFAAADIVISRAGANAICEILALKKPNLLIPLPTAGSRGDQLLNASSFEKQGFSMVLEEEEMNVTTLVNNVNHLFEKRENFRETMLNSSGVDSINTIMSLIEEFAK